MRAIRSIVLATGAAVFVLTPVPATAFSISDLWSPFAEAAIPSSALPSFSGVLKAATNSDPASGKGSDVAIAGGVALVSESGPDGTASDIAQSPASNHISIYVVRKGDSLAAIAKMYGVSTNTILWANDLRSGSDIQPGDTLVILPVSGVQHVVAKGETLASIVKKYHGDMQDVLGYNGLSAGAAIAVGDTIIIPDGVDGSGQAPAQGVSGAKTGGSALVGGSSPGCVSRYERLVSGYSGPSLPGYFIRPIAGGVKTQCLHGYNAVDLGTPTGTQVMAAADGTVIVARSSGYNGGYGEYIAINHPNGTQTVYGHLSKVYVTSGQEISQGQIVGLSGNTGRSTGPHLHFEIRGAANPF